MRNFLCIANNVDVVPLLMAVQRQDLWNQHRFRTTFKGTPHKDVDDIWLRYTDDKKANPDDPHEAIIDTTPIWHEAYKKLPQVKPIIFDLMRRLEAYELGRVLITRLKPGGRILPHSDNYGDYVLDPDVARYHIVLQGLPGSLYRTGDETVCMKTGEVWWFNALIEHEVMNNSSDDRIHLLVDVRLSP